MILKKVLGTNTINRVYLLSQMNIKMKMKILQINLRMMIKLWVNNIQARQPIQKTKLTKKYKRMRKLTLPVWKAMRVTKQKKRVMIWWSSTRRRRFIKLCIRLRLLKQSSRCKAIWIWMTTRKLVHIMAQIHILVQRRHSFNTRHTKALRLSTSRPNCPRLGDSWATQRASVKQSNFKRRFEN